MIQDYSRTNLFNHHLHQPFSLLFYSTFFLVMCLVKSHEVICAINSTCIPIPSPISRGMPFGICLLGSASFLVRPDKSASLKAWISHTLLVSVGLSLKKYFLQISQTLWEKAMVSFPACVPPLLEIQTECCPLLPPQGHLLSIFWSKFPLGTFFLFRRDSHLTCLQKSLLESSDLPQSGLVTLDRWHAFITVIIPLCHPELSLLSFQMLDPIFLCRTPFPEFHDLLFLTLFWRSTLLTSQERVHERWVVFVFCFLEFSCLKLSFILALSNGSWTLDVWRFPD